MFLRRFDIGTLNELGTGQSMTGAELHAEAERRAKALYDTGLRTGHGLFLYRHNSIEFFAWLLGAWSLGAWVAPLDKGLPALAKDALEQQYRPRVIVDDAGARPANSEGRVLENIAVILTTSGSTGTPKGITHTFDGLAGKMSALDRYVGATNLRHAFCALPTFFGHGLICNSLFPLLTGQQLTIASSFTPALAAELADILRAREISFFSSTPIVWKLLGQFAEMGQQIPSLVRVHCASAPFTETDKTVMHEWCEQPDYWNIYGLTEFLGWVSGARIGAGAGPGNIGPGWDVEIKLEAEEILLKGPAQSPLYPGWFSTRDQRVREADGTYRLLGRLDFLINKAGLKIQPEEVEQRAMQSGLLTDCCCFSVKDTLQGECVGLAYVMKSGASESVDLGQRELRNFLAARLPAFQVPDRYFALNEMPRTNRGKLDRKRVRAQLGLD